MSREQRPSGTYGDIPVSAWLSNPTILAILLAALSFLIYIQTLGFEFVSDDQLQVVANPLVLSWRMIPRALESNLWFQIASTGSYYRPFFIIWSILNHALFGFDPRGWHFLNVVLHVIGTTLVFILLRKLKAAYVTAGLAAFIFAIHPVHIEPVAWIAAGSDTLVTVFYLAGFLAYLESREPDGKNRPAWLLLSCVGAASALLTKETAISFPIIVFLYEWLFPRGTLGPNTGPSTPTRSLTATLAALPFFLLDIAYLLQRKHVLRGILQPHAYDRPSLIVTLKTIPIVLLHYLRLLVLPSGLNSFYYISPVTHVLEARFLLPVLGCLALAALVWYWFRRDQDPLIPFFAFWLLVCLVPVLYLPTFKLGDFVRDRYLYLPSVGFVFLLARLFQDLRNTPAFKKEPWLNYALPAVLALAFLGGTYTQQIYWANDLLYYRGHSLSPRSTGATKFLAATLNRLDEPENAVPLLQEVISEDSHDSYATFTLAVVYSRLGRIAEANQQLARTLALSPDYYLDTSDGLTNTGIALSNLHRYDDAGRCFRKALQLEPDAVLAHFYLGMLLLRTQHPPEAEQQLREALRINSTIPDLHWAYGLSREIQNDPAGALAAYREELRLHPQNKQALISVSKLTGQP